MSKLFAAEGDPHHLLFECPGCECLHGFSVAPGRWTWDGMWDAPTVQPSLLTYWSKGPEHREQRCHLFIVKGQLQFLADCTHKLAGQTVDMVELGF